MEEKNNEALAIATAIKEGFDTTSMLPKWQSYTIVSKVKSVRRAIRRGHVDLFFGLPFPRKPFNNRKPTPGRSYNELKKKLYGWCKL